MIATQHFERLLAGELGLSPFREALQQDLVYEAWIVAGQSNMAGASGNLPALGLTDQQGPQDGFYMLDYQGNIMPAVWPFHFPDGSTTPQGPSPGIEALRLRRLNGANRILIISAAEGGTGLHWDSGAAKWYGSAAYGGSGAGGANWQNVVNRVNAAIAAGARIVIRGILWQQGENDAAAAITKAEYKQAFLSMVNGWKGEIDAQWLPSDSEPNEHWMVLIGGLADKLVADGFETTGPPPISIPGAQYAVIDEALRELGNENRRFCYVSAEGLTLNPESQTPDNDIHFDLDSTEEFGRRFYYAMGSVDSTLWNDTGRVESFVNHRGVWDPTGTTFPGGARKGDFWIANQQSTVGAEVDGVRFQDNDILLALVDGASTTTFAANWLRLARPDIEEYVRVFASGNHIRHEVRTTLTTEWSLSGAIEGEMLQYQGPGLTPQVARVVSGKDNAAGSATGRANAFFSMLVARNLATGRFATVGATNDSTGGIVEATLVASDTGTGTFGNIGARADRATCALTKADISYGLFVGHFDGTPVDAGTIRGEDYIDLFVDDGSTAGRMTVRINRGNIEVYKNSAHGSIGTKLLTIDDTGIRYEVVGDGPIVKSADGTAWRIGVNNDGTLSTTAV